MAEITEEQLTKLPKYARDRIEELERVIAKQREQLDTLTGDPESSNTVANPYAKLKNDGAQAIGLGNCETVGFKLGDLRDSSIRAQIIDRGHGSELEINGDYSLNIRIGSSNLVYVSIVSR